MDNGASSYRRFLAGDDSGLAVALFVSHRFHLNLSVNQPISLLGCM